jgi:hypothetical protein
MTKKVRLQLDLSQEEAQAFSELKEKQACSTVEAIEQAMKVYDFLLDGADQTIEVTTKDGQVQHRFPVRLIL